MSELHPHEGMAVTVVVVMSIIFFSPVLNCEVNLMMLLL